MWAGQKFYFQRFVADSVSDYQLQFSSQLFFLLQNGNLFISETKIYGKFLMEMLMEMFLHDDARTNLQVKIILAGNCMRQLQYFNFIMQQAFRTKTNIKSGQLPGAASRH